MHDRGFLPFEQVEHTADVAYIARGRNAPELFVNAALGLMSFLFEPGSVRIEREERMTVSGADPEELLVVWLQEILYRVVVQDRVYLAFQVDRLEPPRCEGTCRGELRDPDRHVPLHDVKAVTWHDVRITEADTAGGSRLLQVRIVLDV